MDFDAGNEDPEELMSKGLLLLEQGGEAALQEFLALHPTHAEAIRAGLEKLQRMGFLAPPPPAQAPELPDLPECTHYGEFRVLRRIGTGGMGVVYAAEQTSLQRTVALKVVRPEFLLLKTARERFQREIEAIARLQHPGIVPILAVGNEGAQPWFAMEYIEGHTLDECLARLRGKDPSRLEGTALRTSTSGAGGTPSGQSPVFAGHYWEACVRLVAQVATAMSYVHERGIVHRDLKPSNIVVDRQGRAMVLDFGLAHVRDLQRMTVEQAQLGSPAYVSPEQVRGEAIDERVDIYGLGVTLYEMLTMHLPFNGASGEAMQNAILAGNAPRLQNANRAVPRDLAVVCAVAMDRDRARRYGSMADFAADLDAVLVRRPICARPLGLGLHTLRWAQRHPGWAAATGTLLLVALLFPLVLWRLQAEANTRLAKANSDLETATQRVSQAHAGSLASAEQARRQTTRLHIAEANRRQNDGDYLGALSPLVAALRTSPDQAAEHTTRIAAALRTSPQVEHHWTLPSWHDRRDRSLAYPGHVFSAEWSPDGKWIACATGSLHIHLWDVDTGVDHGSEFVEEGVEFVRWNRDGTRLLTGTGKNTLTLWDVASKKALLRDLRHDLNASSPSTLAVPVMDAAGNRIVAFTRNGGVVAALPGEGSLQLPLPGRSRARSLALASDETSLAVGMDDGTIVFHDGKHWQPGQCKVREPVRVMSFSPDGRRLAVISGARTLSLWDLTQSPAKPIGEPIQHDAYAYTLQWSADSGRVVSGAYGERSVIMVRADSGLTQWVVQQAPGAMAATLSPDGKQVLTAGFDNAARIFATDTGEPDGPPLHHAAYVSVARFAPDGRRIFTGAYDGTARVWRLPELPVAPPDIANSKPSQGGRFLARRDWKEGSVGTILVYDMADGRLVGRTGPGRCGGLSDNGHILVWDGHDGFAVQEFTSTQEPHTLATFKYPYDKAPTDKREVELSPTAQRAVVTSDRRHWTVFDVSTQEAKLLGSFTLAADCSAIAFSSDGRLFAMVSRRTDRERGSLISIQDLVTAQPVSHFTTLQATAQLEFRPDGQHLACGGATPGFLGGAVRIHRCADGQPVTPYLAHRGNLEDLEFSPDGRLLATGSRDSVARLWDVATGTLAAPEMVHTHHVAHLSFSRDGTRLVTTTAARPSLRVWHVSTGEAMTPPLQLSRGTWLSRFTEDGSALISAGDVFMRWPLTAEDRSADDLVLEADFLCARRHDPLTGERPIPPAELQRMQTTRRQAGKAMR